MSSDPILPEAVYGWRGWRVFDSEDGAPTLWSSKREVSWDEPLKRAGCCDPFSTHPPERSPDADCHCGIYALHEPDLTELLFWGGSVFGLIAGRGSSQLHAQGWRAEESQLLALFVISDQELEDQPNRITRGALERRTQIDYSELEALGRRYGVPTFHSLSEAQVFASSLGIKRVSAELCAEDEWGPSSQAVERMAEIELKRIVAEISKLQKRARVIQWAAAILTLVSLALILISH